MSVRRIVALVLLLVPSLAPASPRARIAPDLATGSGAQPTGSVCGRGEAIRCFAHVRLDERGTLLPADSPTGLGPADLRSAYQVDPAIAGSPTVAIVDAYGYASLESDLAAYRREFGLPPCTRASGCLTIVNQKGAAQPLPPEPPPDDDWTIETALDVDVISAVCPKCKILVVQATSPSPLDMYTAQNAAAAAHPAVISDSWGGPEQGDLSVQEPFFDHPGIAQFAAAGDAGFNNGGAGPNYPSTSAHVIAVGGTSLVEAPNARGFTETAWVEGGSSCSGSIARPAFQPASPCTKRVAADIAAIGDPQTGVAVFNAANGGWLTLGGTSAAAPIVAAIFASIGRGDITAAQLAQSTGALFDVTAGRNGSCSSILCNAGAGWDGPTGFGTPSAARLAAGGIGGGTGGGALEVKITSPADNATVPAGFKVTATASASAAAVGIAIDGELLQIVLTPPYEFTTPKTLAPGRHLVQIAADDADSNEVVAQINVTVTAGGGGGIGLGGGGGGDSSDTSRTAAGCNAGEDPGAPIALVIVLAFGAVIVRRSRRHS
jgi:hypothetical protein